MCASPVYMAAIYDGQRVRIVIGPTAVSGDSYMLSDIVNRYLQKYLGCNSKIDPVGANEAFATIQTAAPDGLTFMIFHDMTYLGVLFGSYVKEYALENMTVGPRVGQNPGSCFAAKANAPYKDMKEMADWLKANPDKTVRVSVELGSVSNLGFVIYYVWLKDTYGDDVANRMRFVVGGSTDTKLQQIWDGNADVIFGDYSSFLQYTAAGVDEQLALKYVGIMDKIPGRDDLPVYGDIRSGFQLLPLLIGLFAIAQMFQEAEKGMRSNALVEGARKFSFSDFAGQWINVIRSSLFGTFMGVLPGVGGSAASLIAYSQAKSWQKSLTS